VADLSPAGRGLGDGATADGRDRGQIILVGAFALAVVFVALALVMNAAIYTENLATRSESAGAADAQAFERATTNAAEAAFRYAHEVNASDHTGLKKNVTQAMAAYHNVTRTQQATSAQLTDVAVDSTTNGTNITDTSVPFESPAGGTDWTVAKDVNESYRFRIDVETWNGGSSDELWIVAGDAGDWYLNVSEASGEWEVGVNESGTYTRCLTTTASDVTIDLVAETVNGNDCPALNRSAVGDPYDIAVRNGSVADGGYTLVSDGEAGSDLTTSQYDEILYAMEVNVTYWTPELRYRTTRQITWGEASA